jgi:hypothetical protein
VPVPVVPVPVVPVPVVPVPVVPVPVVPVPVVSVPVVSVPVVPVPVVPVPVVADAPVVSVVLSAVSVDPLLALQAPNNADNRILDSSTLTFLTLKLPLSNLVVNCILRISNFLNHSQANKISYNKYKPNMLRKYTNNIKTAILFIYINNK